MENKSVDNDFKSGNIEMYKYLCPNCGKLLFYYEKSSKAKKIHVYCKKCKSQICVNL